MKEFIISENDSDQRVDKFIHKVCKSIPDSLIYKSIRMKKIKVNRKRCDGKTRLNVGDSVQCFLADHFFEESVGFVPNDKAIDIIYEDENILIMHKPVGVLSQSSEGGNQDCMVLRVQSYLYHKGEFDPSVISSFRPALVHRLDRNTEGLIMAGKNAKALRELNRIIKEREIEKYYICICDGVLAKKSIDVSLYHHKDSNNKVHISNEMKTDYQSIGMQYECIAIKGNHSLCNVLLKTGKSHQIRAGMAFLGFPLMGDVKYYQDLNCGYQALCANRIVFKIKPDSFLSYLNSTSFNLVKNEVVERWDKL